MSAELTITDPEERADLGAFVARVVRLDAASTVLLRAGGPAAGGVAGGTGAGTVTAWASTPFDVLATRSAVGTLAPAETAVAAGGLLTALSVERAATVDPGAEVWWPGEQPPVDGWSRVEEIPGGELEALTERGLAVAREHRGPMGPPASLLDQVVLTVTPNTAAPAPVRGAVKVPLRCLFALSGMGFLAGSDDPVRVSATGTWMRLDARFGAVVRRRTTALPLLVT